ncbi:MAG: hypothetical protein K6B40_00155 [Firmicutes bacterium]|nr:hypothetical protein [Bacillota bacterium]
MTNKELYQRAFSTLHASCDPVMEVEKMKRARKKRFHKPAAVAAALVLVLGLASVAYATDIGGIQRSIQLWMHGDQTDAILEVENGHYSLTYEDADGNVRHQSGGGVAVGMDGKARPATEEEILQELNSPEVVYQEDGTVWVYYFDQKVEITDKFDDRGVCYVQLKDGDGVLYMTIKDQSGYSASRHSYPNPRSFN